MHAYTHTYIHALHGITYMHALQALHTYIHPFILCNLLCIGMLRGMCEHWCTSSREQRQLTSLFVPSPGARQPSTLGPGRVVVFHRRPTAPAPQSTSRDIAGQTVVARNEEKGEGVLMVS